MAPLGGMKKSKRGKKTPLFTHMTGRRNAKRKPLLPKKGLTQTSYESGFFDFFKVFWKNNRTMELCNLTKQVANAWDALLPKPKLSKKQVLKDYSRELRSLQEEEERRIRSEQEKQKKERMVQDKNAGTDTEASSIADSEESDRSGKNSETDDESRSGKQSTDDGSTSGKQSTSQNDSESEFESDSDTYSRNREQKRKRKGRKYENYEEYLKKRKTGSKNKQADETTNDENNSEMKEDLKDQSGNPGQNPKDAVFFPIKEETSFDRIVKNDYDNQVEMLRKLKHYGTNKDPNTPDNEDLRSSSSSYSQRIPLGGLKFPPPDRDTNPISPKLCNPTDTLHVKNLVLGIRQPELQEIFRVFLKDIVMIRVLDNKFNGEAAVEFKNVEAAERVWKQMNGVEYKRLPLVLEFANKEDLLY